jgi:hypothetical protein
MLTDLFPTANVKTKKKFQIVVRTQITISLAIERKSIRLYFIIFNYNNVYDLNLGLNQINKVDGITYS